jgi:type I restriction enzyme M protein
LWSNGTTPVVWHRRNPNYFVEIPDLPTVHQTIEDIAGQPWTIDTLIEKEEARAKEGILARSLRDLIEDMEDEVLANAGVDIFEEVFKLIFTKLYDELACYRGCYPHLRFRISNTAAQLKANIQKLFDDAKEEWPGVFSPDERISSPPTISKCASARSKSGSSSTPPRRHQRRLRIPRQPIRQGREGAILHPALGYRPLREDAFNPREDETLIDTACGSAGSHLETVRLHSAQKVPQRRERCAFPREEAMCCGFANVKFKLGLGSHPGAESGLGMVVNASSSFGKAAEVFLQAVVAGLITD